MAWRRARSLEVLQDEIWELHPKTTIWALGDPAHQATWSDHNPNAAGVVCAIDVLGNGGLDLAWFAGRIVATDPPALKYVIFNRRIWFPDHGWQPYYGSNPHTTHVHVSVGWGPDGRSTGNYDDTSPWGLLPAKPPPEEGDMRLNDRIRLQHKEGTATIESALAWTWNHAAGAITRLKAVEANQSAILAAVAGRDVLAAVEAKLTEHHDALADHLDALAGQLADVAELVRQATSGERDAAAVVNEIAERLNRGVG